jgi:SAM-dependent methyltransferase
MHEAVLSWVGQFRTDEDLSVLDIGGRDLNGSPRSLFPNANPYHVLDLRPGPNVDFVGDAATWRSTLGTAGRPWYDLVICTEVFEHTPGWALILQTALDCLRPGGWLLFTCAGPGRPPHSGIEPVAGLIGDEWYANVSPQEIEDVLRKQGWIEVETHLQGTDTQGKAVKPTATV